MGCINRESAQQGCLKRKLANRLCIAKLNLLLPQFPLSHEDWATDSGNPFLPQRSLEPTEISALDVPNLSLNTQSLTVFATKDRNP